MPALIAASPDFGTREFGTLDLDGNLLTFFERQGAATRPEGFEPSTSRSGGVRSIH